MQRRRHIRGGHFGALRKSTSQKKEGLMTVKRTRTICGGAEDGRISSISLNLSYVIYRHDLIQSTKKKPLLVIHGGPSIPSDYLQPMAKTLSDRCIIFYDQIGCGNSSSPNDLNFYSIDNAVHDLESLIQHLKLKEFHLYGHSFGGIVAYEYSKRQCERLSYYAHHQDVHETSTTPPAAATTTLLSLTLCSTPSNLRVVEYESKVLLDSTISTSSSTIDTHGTDDLSIDDIIQDCDDYDNGDEGPSCKTASFQKAFVCRTNDGTVPIPLQEAYKKKGTVWEGPEVVIDYVASPMIHGTTKASSSKQLLHVPHPPPAMLLRGEFDFVSEKYAHDEWKKNLMEYTTVICHTMNECAHYSMLENPALHSMTLETFLVERESGDSSVKTVIQ